MTTPLRPRCPGWHPSILSRLRRHTTCYRPLRFLPGLLNSYLDLGPGRASRILYTPGDMLVLEYNGEGSVDEDNIYVLETGPRYTQYRLHHYTKGKIVGSCDPTSVPDAEMISLFTYQRLTARPRAAEGLELCGINNSIVPVDERGDRLLSWGLVHPLDLKPVEGGEPAPWYVDSTLAPELSKVEVTLGATGYVGESLASETVVVEALHPAPEDYMEGETPRPHLAVVEWDRVERSLKLVLLPLYSYTEEYRSASLLSTIYLLSIARERGSHVDERELRKTYKKISKTLEKFGLPRPEGGVPALIRSPVGGAYRVRDDKVELGDPCKHCIPAHRATRAGLDVIVSSLETGSLLIL
ncbi:MAG: hypothetical protein F7C35_00935 [Desulfurococcales archaeon]|nr:hypothetical protein [Desulfurococcales archaeon]